MGKGIDHYPASRNEEVVIVDIGDPRRFREFRPAKEQRREIGDGEPKPMPLGDKCYYLCPYFKCNKKALMITMKYMKGNPYKVGKCRWVGDTCITGDCQYAYCEKRALLPGNKCAFAIKRREDTDKEEEYEEDQMESKVKEILSKKLGGRDIADI